VAVIVVVADADGVCPANIFQSGLLCNLGEGAVTIVFVESIRGAGRTTFKTCAAQKKNVEPAVVIVVEESAAATIGLDDELLAIDATINDGATSPAAAATSTKCASKGRPDCFGFACTEATRLPCRRSAAVVRRSASQLCQRMLPGKDGENRAVRYA